MPPPYCGKVALWHVAKINRYLFGGFSNWKKRMPWLVSARRSGRSARKVARPTRRRPKIRMC